MRSPVSPEPVKASTSWAPSSAGRSRGAPTSICSAPSGRTFASTITCIARCAAIAVAVAGLESTGMPASSAAAAFSASPQAGKLNALMCTATPCRGTARCWPWKRGDRPSWMPSPSTRNFPAPSAWPSSAYERRVAIAPSTSNFASERVLPPLAMFSASSSSRASCSASATPWSSAPRSANPSARSAGPPVLRA